MKSIKMTLEEVRSRMSKTGLAIERERRLPNDKGSQIVTVHGQVVDVYNSGTTVVQGREAERLRTVLSDLGNGDGNGV